MFSKSTITKRTKDWKDNTEEGVWDDFFINISLGFAIMQIGDKNFQPSSLGPILQVRFYSEM